MESPEKHRVLGYLLGNADAELRRAASILLPDSFRMISMNLTRFNPSCRFSTRILRYSNQVDPDATQLPLTEVFIPPGMNPTEVTKKMILPGSNIVLGPYAGHSDVKEVEFVKSSSRVKDCPSDVLPEFAILGRSNVGKSSLINYLVRKKKIALTSKTPGKTQLINHFLVNKNWHLVDFPGYGYARASKSARKDWACLTKDYLVNRKMVAGVMLLIDGCVPPQALDLEFASWLHSKEIPATLVLTKCDKLRRRRRMRKKEEAEASDPGVKIKTFLELAQRNLGSPSLSPWIMTSSVMGFGRDELLQHMSQLRNYFIR